RRFTTVAATPAVANAPADNAVAVSLFISGLSVRPTHARADARHHLISDGAGGGSPLRCRRFAIGAGPEQGHHVAACGRQVPQVDDQLVHADGAHHRNTTTLEPHLGTTRSDAMDAVAVAERNQPQRGLPLCPVSV